MQESKQLSEIMFFFFWHLKQSKVMINIHQDIGMKCNIWPHPVTVPFPPGFFDWRSLAVLYILSPFSLNLKSRCMCQCRAKCHIVNNINRTEPPNTIWGINQFCLKGVISYFFIFSSPRSSSSICPVSSFLSKCALTGRFLDSNRCLWHVPST